MGIDNWPVHKREETAADLQGFGFENVKNKIAEDGMETDMNKYETLKQQTEGEHSSAGAAAQSFLNRGAEAYGQAEKAVSDVYDKTAQKVTETYKKAKSYSNANPGKTILIALGIGVGLGFLLGASSSSRRSRTGRFAQPVVNALSDIALEFFR